MYTIAVPVYNEEKIVYSSIIRIYKKIQKVEKKLNLSIELLIVDDGSKDNTIAEIQRAQKKYPDIQYRQEKGPSRRENLIKCMLETKSEYVGWMDCDIATDLKDFENLICFSKYYDIVTGSRYLASSIINRHLSRMIISFLYNNLVRILFKSKIRDHWCGFKIFKRTVLKQIIDYMGIGNLQRKMFWDSQMWVYAQNLGFKALEIPVTWEEKNQSALKIHTEIPMLLYMFKFWFSGRWKKLSNH